MHTLAAAVVLAGLSTPAAAQGFPCSGAAVSPYPALIATDHDHDRVAPRPAALSKRFTAFLASFDDADDDDGDGTGDLRLNPEFVAYELRGVGTNENGEYAEPAVSIRRPGRWYSSPELVPLVGGLNAMPCATRS